MKPFFSIITPVLNGGAAFGQCLTSLRASTFNDWELLVVDDGSTDDSAARASEHGARVLTTPGRQGPAVARNMGAQVAKGTYLLFLDADCEVGPETLERAARVFKAEPELDALFGSYDDAPAAGNFVAQYKNLQHHYVHQTASEDASTFWAGCGAVRRTVFLELGGFDVECYPRPSIEDIELGYRLKRAGRSIRLAKDVQVKHHKAWRFWGLLKTDIFDRAIPWTQLILSDDNRINDLNVDRQSRHCVAASLLLAATLPLAIFHLGFLAPAGVAAAFLFIANRGFYGFLARLRGAGFALRAVPLHWLYYIYCGGAFAAGLSLYLSSRYLNR